MSTLVRPHLAKFLFRSAGMILIAAAALKASSFTSSSETALAVVACVEAIVGVWLITRANLPLTRWLAIFVYSVLMGAALLLSAINASVCNCFGHFSVNPLWMIAADGAALSLMLSVSMNTEPRPSATELAFLLLLVAAGISLGAFGAFLVNVRGDAVVVSIHHWRDSAQHLIDDSDIFDKLHHGEWLILLHRPNCARCEAAVYQFRHFAIEASKTGRQKFAMIDVSPLRTQAPFCENALEEGQLLGQKFHYIQTPLYLSVSHGRILNAFESLDNVPLN